MAIIFDPENGFSVDSTSTIRQAIVNDWTQIFDDESATLNTSSSSPAGQIIDSMAVLVTAKDSELLKLANQFNPLTADGVFQDAIGAIYFLTRKTATSTVVSCTCTGLQGTTIPAGSVIQTTDGVKLSSVGAATIPSGGEVDIEFATQEKGAIEIGAHTCTKIVTVIAGWDTVDNDADGTPGSVIESRADFEKRRYLSVAANAHGTRAAVQGAIYSINDVLDCIVLENRTDESVELQGITLIPHSVAICVYGGTDAEIARMIYNKLDAGCGTNGNTVVTYISEDGVSNSYNIVRPTPTPVYVRVEINKTIETPSTISRDIKDAILSDANGTNQQSGNTRIGMGETIYASRFTVAVVQTAKVTDLVALFIGWTSSPSDNSIVVDADIEPIFTDTNIEVLINEP